MRTHGARSAPTLGTPSISGVGRSAAAGGLRDHVEGGVGAPALGIGELRVAEALDRVGASPSVGAQHEAVQTVAPKAALRVDAFSSGAQGVVQTLVDVLARLSPVT